MPTMIYDVHEMDDNYLVMNPLYPNNDTAYSDNVTDIPADQTVLYSTPSLVCGVVMILIALVGIIGNAITATVFSLTKKTCKATPNSSTSILAGGSHMSTVSSASHQSSQIQNSRLSSIAILVTGLSIVDAVLLSLSCPLFASSAFYAYEPTLTLMNAVSYMTVYVYPLASIFQTASVWILSLITVERYVAVVHPFLARIVCTPSRALYILIGTILISACYNAPRFWEYRVYRIVAADDPDVVLIVALPVLRDDQQYMRLFGHWMYFVFIFAVPFAILVFFNGGVVRAVRLARRHRRALSRQQTKEQGTAVMMLVVALVFLVCNLLAFILNALEVFGWSGARRVPLPDANESSDTGSSVRHSSTFYLLVDLNNVFVMTHCSVNFFIYYNFSERFRSGCTRLLRRCTYCVCLRSARLRGTAPSYYYTDDLTVTANQFRGASTTTPVGGSVISRRCSSRCSYSRKNSCASGKNTVVTNNCGWTIGDAPIHSQAHFHRISRVSYDSGVRTTV